MSGEEPEIIEISDLGSSSKPSSNFGPGIELLMNDRVKENKKKPEDDNIGIELLRRTFNNSFKHYIYCGNWQ